MKAHPTTRYNRVGPEVWLLIRRAYLSGLSAPTVAARFGVSVPALRRRAAREGWTKVAFARSGLKTGFPVEPTPDRASAQTDAAPPAPINTLLDRLYPPPPGPIGLMQQTLDQARSAVRDGDGLRAQRLARAAEAIRRLDDWYERRLGRIPFDELTQVEREIAEARRTETLKIYVADMALHLARRLAEGHPLPPDYQSLLDQQRAENR